MNFIKKSIPFLFLMLILLIIIPVTPFFMDVLIIISMSFSMLIFLQALYTRNVLEFSIFPTMLLYVTFTRIALNVCSMRLILGSGEAGQIIDSVGRFSIGKNFVVGILAYFIIALVMLILISKGSSRIAEVSARFALDAMPGKQMAIEGELQTGMITADEAQRKRENIQREVSFFGSMDGASKFVSGDATVSLIITIINIVGGLIIGMVQKGMSFNDAANTYMILSIGEGIVNQVSSLFVSIAAATMETKGKEDMDFGESVIAQFTKYSEVLKKLSYAMFAMAALGLLKIVPGMSWGLFLIFGFAFLYVSRYVDSHPVEVEDAVQNDEVIAETNKVATPDKIALELGLDVAPVVWDFKTDYFLPEFKEKLLLLKGKFKEKYHFDMPEIKVKTNFDIDSSCISVKIRGQEVSLTKIKYNQAFMICGDNTRLNDEPQYFLPYKCNGYWIDESKVHEEQFQDMLSLTPMEMIIAQLAEDVNNNIDKIITRQNIKAIEDEVVLYDSAVVDEMHNKQIPTGVVEKVIQNLFIESVPIHDFEFVFENICNAYENMKNPNADMITEFIRESLGDVVSAPYVKDGILKVIGMSNEAQEIFATTEIKDDETVKKLNSVYGMIIDKYKEFTKSGETFAFVVDRRIRNFFFKQLFGKYKLKVNVISTDEIPSGNKNIKIDTLDFITIK